MRKTKIVATLGPASDSEDVVRQLLEAGVDVVRQNFSHGTHEEHSDVLETVHEKSEQVPVMMDTQGPEVRLQNVNDDITLDEDDTVEITVDDVPSTAEQLSVDYNDFLGNMDEADTVLVGDGDIELEVTDSDGTATCRVVYGGTITANKSVNVPGKDVGPDGLTEKDREDIRFGAQAGFDLVSVSFVKRKEDVTEVRTLLNEEESDAQIIAKIEHVKAVENFDGILDAADGIMIARGDLGVELPASEVPVIQKELIRNCNEAGKPVITATQMLSSMTEHPRATRAEISDIANAVMDGTDAVMLSEETAVGDYPVRSVDVMVDAVEHAEDYMRGRVPDTVKSESRNVEDVIAKSIWQASHDVDARYIVAHTSSGYTARNIAKYRPDEPIIAFTDNETVRRQLNLTWGVRAHYIEFPDYVDDMICDSVFYLADNDLVVDDDLLILSAGVPTSTSGTTNMMEIRTVDEILDEHECR